MPTFKTLDDSVAWRHFPSKRSYVGRTTTPEALQDTTNVFAPPPNDPLWKNVIGVHFNGCVSEQTGGKGFTKSGNAAAHAHNYRRGTNFGWICVKDEAKESEVDFVTKHIVKPGTLLMHELAHMLCINHHHDDTWRNKMKELGQPLWSMYTKRRRWVSLPEEGKMACCGNIQGIRNGTMKTKCKACGKVAAVVMTYW